MESKGEVFELPVRSPLGDLAWMFASPWVIGSWLLIVSFLVTRIRHAGDLPFFTNFSLPAFCGGMFCLWLLARWVHFNYTINYQFDPGTQQVYLTRTIAGQPFKVCLAEFSEIHAVGIQSSWFDGRGVRNWTYQLCLVTRAAKIIKFSPSYGSPPGDQSAELARKLGVLHFPCQEETGRLIARRRPDGELELRYNPEPPPQFELLQLLKLMLFLTVVIVSITILSMAR